MRLEDASNREAREFFAKYPNDYVAERLRSDWLRVLGKRADWTEFDRQSPLYTRDDLEVACYRWSSRIERGDELALADAMAMWLEPAELPEGCQRLSLTLSARGRLSVTDIWRRVRVLFEHGQITASKTALALLPKKEAPDERMLAEAARQPKRLLERLPKVLETRAAREVAVAGRGARCAQRCRRHRSGAQRRARRALLAVGAALPLGPGRLRSRARAPRARARVVRTRRHRAARGSPPCLEGARGTARRAVAGGARIDRSHVACLGEPPGVDLLVWPRARGAERGHGEPRLLPAHRRPERFLRPAGERGAGLPRRAAAGDLYAERGGSRRRRRRAGPGARARAHPPRHPRRGRARMAVRHPLLRRPEADRRGRARPPRRRLRSRDPYRRSHLPHP